jgi:ketosteroid isomerase-like protein
VASDPEAIVRELYAAMNERDFTAAERLADPDVEWISDPRTGLGSRRGREEVLRFFRDQSESFAEVTIELDDIDAAGDTVLALIRVKGRGSASGAEVEISIAHVWEVNDGRVVRGRGFGDRDVARKAAGL